MLRFIYRIYIYTLTSVLGILVVIFPKKNSLIINIRKFCQQKYIYTLIKKFSSNVSIFIDFLFKARDISMILCMVMSNMKE
jgi:hypothetical protein